MKENERKHGRVVQLCATKEDYATLIQNIENHVLRKTN